MAAVLRFSQTVRIEEEQVSVPEGGLLRLVVKAVQHTYRQVRLDLQHSAVQYRRVVSSVAVMQMAGAHVQNSDKEGNEHILVVLLGECVVDLDRDSAGMFLMRRDASEE